MDAIAVEMAGPPPHYLPNDLTTRAGDLVFFVTNKSRGSHNIAIGRGPLKFSLARQVTNVPVAWSGTLAINESATFRITGISPGAYLFWCTISNHADEGMKGTLTVNP